VIDYYRFSIPGFFAMALALCAVAPACLFWPPIARFGIVYFFAPYVAALFWLAVIIMAVRVHRWRGLWVLVTAIVIVPEPIFMPGSSAVVR
jgi:hypothetical protein